MDVNSLFSNADNLPKEILKSNAVGAVCATTTIFCNTKCWHGLLSVYNPLTKEQKVLLSNIDDSIIVDGITYYLSTRKYPNVYFPLGHQYISEVSYNPYPHVVYQVGAVRVVFDMILAANEETVYLQYGIAESPKNVKLQLRPLLAFRDAMRLIRRDTSSSFITEAVPIEGGVFYRPRMNEPELYMQTSKPCDFVSAPDWNYNIEYIYDWLHKRLYQEDLFMPGFFEVELAQGENFVISFSTVNQNQRQEPLIQCCYTEMQTCVKRDTYNKYLLDAANTMYRRVDSEPQIVEQIPCRDYFSYHLLGALPGLTLPECDTDRFLNVIDNYRRKVEDFSFSEVLMPNYDPESPLWLVWSIQQYSYYVAKPKDTYDRFAICVNSIINAGMNNGLAGLHTSNESALMKIDRGEGPRYYIDINALWFNALHFAVEINTIGKDVEMVNIITQYAKKVKTSFKTRFIDRKISYLVDSLDENFNKDLTCAPRQLLAIALPYPICDDESYVKPIVDIVENKLLTKFGLRLCPQDSDKYKQNSQNGDIYPIYLGFLAEIYLKYMGNEGLEKAKKIFNFFNNPEVIKNDSPNFFEKYAPEEPYDGKGSPMFAGTIATFNRIKMLIDQF